MKKLLWIIPALLVIGLIIGLVLWKKKQDARPFNHYDFPSSISVTNGTISRADTLVLVLAHQIFELDTLDIKIFYLPEHINKGDIEFQGIVQKLPFGSHKYLILIKRDMYLDKLKMTLSHEFIHIAQYESGRLIIDGKNYLWEGEPGVFDGYDVKRPFEQEAFNSQVKIRHELNEFLYD